MKENKYVYETKKRSNGKDEYQVRRLAKEQICIECNYKWLIRKDRKSSIYCKECLVKGERNPMYGKVPYNKGKIYFDGKAYRRNYQNKKRHESKMEMIKYFGNECSICHQKNLPICVWHFHHVEPKNKLISVSQILSYGKKKLIEEVKKCVMLCSNCHLTIHHGDERLEP